MEVSLRRAVPSDAATIVDFNCHLAMESEGLTLDRALIEPGVAACLDDAAKGFYTLAVIDSEIVGQTMITMEWSDWRNGWFWWIQSVYVKTEYRSRGVFRRLFEHLKDEAAATADVIGLRLYVEHDNEKAKSVYRKLGMKDTPYEMLEMYPLKAHGS